MTLDELLTAARSEPGRGPANRQFWKALAHEIDQSLAGHSYVARVEITQRVMLTVWQRIDRYQQRGPNSLRHWVRSIASLEAQRTQFEAGKLARLEAKLLRETACSPGLTPSRQVLLLERLALMAEAFQRLSPRHRRALDVMEPEPLAASERISVDAARMLIHRAMRRLAQLVSELRKTDHVRVVTSR
jgi:DNA-directed RNA polymerase specialized sigma24 family protein